ncbi:MAG: flagellar protein FlaG [Treponema sp.]|nr:flagellar protein FlaG [Treponema sp.]
MNQISQNSAVHLAMDGQSLYSSANKVNTVSNSNSALKKSTVTSQITTPTGAQVAKSIEQNLAEIKADSQELQKMSEMVAGYGKKVQFSVNKELGSVIVHIVDSNTNQVLKEIPSEDMQKLKLRMRKAIGNLFDTLA